MNICQQQLYFTHLLSTFFADLEWKIIYVGSAESEDYDQTLDTVVVGPIIAGRHMFVFEVINILQCNFL